MKKSLMNNLFLTMFALVLLGMTKLLFNVTIGRFFGPEELGSINIALSISLLFSYIITTGFPPAAVKFLSEYRGRNDIDSTKFVFKLVLFLVVVLSIIVMVIALLFSNVISKYIGIQNNLFIISTLLIPLYALYMYYKNAYYGLDKIKKYAKIELISDIFFFISLFICVIFFRSYLILPFIIMYFVFSIISSYDLRSYLTSSKTQSTNLISKGVLAFAGISFVGSFASMGRANLSIALSGVYVDTISVGYYAAAFSILTIFQFIPMAVGRVIGPIFSYQYGQKNITYISRLLNISTFNLLLIQSLLCAIGIILSSEILQIIFGEEFKSASIVFSLMIISVYISIITTPSEAILSNTKYVKIPNIGGVLGFITSLGAWIVLIPIYGIEGTAIGFLLGTIVNSFIPIYYARKYFNLNIRKNFSVVLITALLLIVTFEIKNVIFAYSNIVSALLLTLFFALIYRKYFKEISLILLKYFNLHS